MRAQMSWIIGNDRTEKPWFFVDVVVVLDLAANDRALYLYDMADQFAKCSDGDHRRRYNMNPKCRVGKIFES